VKKLSILVREYEGSKYIRGKTVVLTNLTFEEALEKIEKLKYEWST